MERGGGGDGAKKCSSSSSSSSCPAPARRGGESFCSRLRLRKGEGEEKDVSQEREIGREEREGPRVICQCIHLPIDRNNEEGTRIQRNYGCCSDPVAAFHSGESRPLSCRGGLQGEDEQDKMRRRRRRRWEKKLEVALEGGGGERSDRSREQTEESENDEMTSSRHHLPEKKETSFHSNFERGNYGDLPSPENIKTLLPARPPLLIAIFLWRQKRRTAIAISCWHHSWARTSRNLRARGGGWGGGGFYYMKFVRFYNGIRRLGGGLGS